MSGIATAIVGAGVIGAGASIYGASQTAGAARDAAGMQAQSAADANALQKYMFETQQSNQQPWLQAGTGAVNTLSAGLAPGGQFTTTPTFDPSKITLDPGYAFRTQAGVNALTAAGAAGGNLGSGNMGVALTNYGQQAGSQEYQNAYQRAMDQYNVALNSQNTIFNRLSGLAGTGQTAANQIGAAGQNYAGNVSNNLMTSAANRGQFGIQGANAIAGGVTGVANQLMGGLQAYNYQNQLSNAGMLQNWGGYSGVVDNYNPYADYSGGGGVGPLAPPAAPVTNSLIGWEA